MRRSRGIHKGADWMIPDNYDQQEIYDAEQERIKRMRHRHQLEIENEDYKEDLRCQHYTN